MWEFFVNLSFNSHFEQKTTQIMYIPAKFVVPLHNIIVRLFEAPSSESI